MPNIDFNLYLITDRGSLPAGRSLLEQVEAALEGGLRAVQLREKNLSPTDLLPLAEQLRELTRRFGAKLLINSCLETALAVDADGIHLPSHNPPIEKSRAALGPDRLIGVSTHSGQEVEAAAKAGADFVTFGPVYPTASKLPYGKPLGPEKLAQVCRNAPLPVFALGGITSKCLPELQNAGCNHFACIGAILKNPDPEVAVRCFLAD